MKDFVKMTLAVVCGFFIIGIICFILSMGALGSMIIAGSASSSPSVPKSAVLKIDMSKIAIAEQAGESLPDFSSLQGGSSVTPVGILDAVKALEAAAQDDAIKCIYLRPDGAAAGMGQLYELRNALDACRQSGKPVVSYIESMTTGGYYLASASDKIYLGASDGVTHMFYGISGQLFFLKDLLDKLGVNVQLIRHGKYKSAGEMYVRSSASPENMEQNQVMISSIWNEFAGAMAAGREMTPDQLNALIDNLKLNFPEDFLEAGLVDELVTREVLQEKIATLYGAEKFKDVKMVSLEDYIEAKVSYSSKAKEKVAIIYADGEIVDGKGTQGVAGDRFAEVIAKVRADSTVKAVVLRVNSPGGSVQAAEKIKHEIDLMKADKPVIASYGDYAASGGYWISAQCDKIISDPTCLTGSIGVFSMIPDFSKTVKNVAHVTFTPVNSNKHSDILSLMRPFDKDELDYMQASVERIYDKFVGIVAEGRSLEPAYVDGIAQGRVWTGRDALEISLVDEIGTLEDALAAAAAAASEGEKCIDDYAIVQYPKTPSAMEQLLEMFGSQGSAEDAFAGTPLKGVASALTQWASQVREGNSGKALARMPYDFTWSY